MKKIPDHITEGTKIFTGENAGIRKPASNFVNQTNQFNKYPSEFNKPKLILYFNTTENIEETKIKYDFFYEINLSTVVFSEVIYEYLISKMDKLRNFAKVHRRILWYPRGLSTNCRSKVVIIKNLPDVYRKFSYYYGRMSAFRKILINHLRKIAANCRSLLNNIKIIPAIQLSLPGINNISIECLMVLPVYNCKLPTVLKIPVRVYRSTPGFLKNFPMESGGEGVIMKKWN